MANIPIWKIGLVGGGGLNIFPLYSFSQCLFIVYLIDATPYMILYLRTCHIHTDMFWRVIAAIIGRGLYLISSFYITVALPIDGRFYIRIH